MSEGLLVAIQRFMAETIQLVDNRQDYKKSAPEVAARFYREIQGLIKAARIEELQRLLDVTSTGGDMPKGTYETDIVLGSLVKNRIAEQSDE